jgi:hypothetical protein
VGRIRLLAGMLPPSRNMPGAGSLGPTAEASSFWQKPAVKGRQIRAIVGSTQGDRTLVQDLEKQRDKTWPCSPPGPASAPPHNLPGRRQGTILTRQEWLAHGNIKQSAHPGSRIHAGSIVGESLCTDGVDRKEVKENRSGVWHIGRPGSCWRCLCRAPW